jgi:hypothetical protein
MRAAMHGGSLRHRHRHRHLRREKALDLVEIACRQAKQPTDPLPGCMPEPLALAGIVEAPAATRRRQDPCSPMSSSPT